MACLWGCTNGATRFLLPEEKGRCLLPQEKGPLGIRVALGSGLGMLCNASQSLRSWKRGTLVALWCVNSKGREPSRAADRCSADRADEA